MNSLPRIEEQFRVKIRKEGYFLVITGQPKNTQSAKISIENILLADETKFLKINSVVKKLLISKIKEIRKMESDHNVKINVGKEAINMTGTSDKVDAVKK